MNRFGAIEIEATKIGEDSSLQKLIKMVQDAENKKAPMQRIADKWATWLVPVALIIAIATFLFTGDIVRGVTVLVVFCPCALVLATPTAIMAAIGQATKYGVIIKSGDALERMGKVNCITFDKTGTLTYGKLVVTDILSFEESISENELLKSIASVELLSEHPLAKAVISYAKDKNISLNDVSDFKMIPGKGIQGIMMGELILCGNAKWLKTLNIEFSGIINENLELLRKQGKAVIIAAKENKVIGIIALADTLRENAKDMILELKETGTKAVLLTGDHKQTAAYLAEKVGITYVHSELLPEIFNVHF